MFLNCLRASSGRPTAPLQLGSPSPPPPPATLRQHPPPPHRSAAPTAGPSPNPVRSTQPPARYRRPPPSTAPRVPRCSRPRSRSQRPRPTQPARSRTSCCKTWSKLNQPNHLSAPAGGGSHHHSPITVRRWRVGSVRYRRPSCQGVATRSRVTEGGGGLSGRRSEGESVGGRNGRDRVVEVEADVHAQRVVAAVELELDQRRVTRRPVRAHLDCRQRCRVFHRHEKVR